MTLAAATRLARARKVKPPLERVVQRQIVTYLNAAGWSVWQTSVGNKHPSGAKGLRVTPGIPDLYAVHAKHGAIWVECKREGGTFTEAQSAFRAAHYRCRGYSHAPDVYWAHSLDELRGDFKSNGWERP